MCGGGGGAAGITDTIGRARKYPVLWPHTDFLWFIRTVQDFFIVFSGLRYRQSHTSRCGIVRHECHLPVAPIVSSFIPHASRVDCLLRKQGFVHTKIKATDLEQKPYVKNPCLI